MYRVGSLAAAARELSRYKLELVVCRRLGGAKGTQIRRLKYLWKKK
jgi:hypothetical protein